MSPIYEFRCTEGHQHEELRRYDDRDEPAECPRCGSSCQRIMSAHHRQPDGIYSYCENVGDPNTLERHKYEGRGK